MKASPEIIDGFLRAVRASFPEPDLLAKLEEPGAVDDVAETWLLEMTNTFEGLPERQRSVLRTYAQAGAKQRKQGGAAPAHDAERAELEQTLRRSLSAYHVPDDAAASLLDPAALDGYDTPRLRELIDTIDRLRDYQRNLLQIILDIDDNAQERARRKALEQTMRDGELAEAAQAAHSMRSEVLSGRMNPDQAKAQREAQREAEREREREQNAADREQRGRALVVRHEEDLQRTMILVEGLDDPALSSRKERKPEGKG